MGCKLFQCTDIVDDIKFTLTVMENLALTKELLIVLQFVHYTNRKLLVYTKLYQTTLTITLSQKIDVSFGCRPWFILVMVGEVGLLEPFVGPRVACMGHGDGPRVDIQGKG